MSETAQQPLKILIADDEENIRRILETRLRMQGYEVAAAVDGAEALELFRGFEPDLVVLDVMMPELDGFAVTERIRAQSEVPIILLTALGDVADRITGDGGSIHTIGGFINGVITSAAMDAGEICHWWWGIDAGRREVAAGDQPGRGWPEHQSIEHGTKAAAVLPDRGGGDTQQQAVGPVINHPAP